ncbi:DUF4956 domain-containing protein [Enorma phocaeensis]|uniref:DUF4956 domain-containing protein n=1 Tax=Enorma phocaeensis TaxID=1871019 RepID=A0ABT7V6T4_9ACTN|nr:DUF4956 domain-containing protein [Enorma phocaeensis]MDM8274212.1 DUF4956 domain-containing protein [Enorma phocaeensis]
MTFNDIFKSSFLDRIDAVPPLDAAIALALACALGLFIVLIYKKTSTNVMHSTSFEATLVALTLITTLVILAVSSNVLLSLGMVGALSIVRFRTPVKEPMDIVFLFWCIAVGIVLAAGLLFLAVTGCIVIGIVLLVFANTRTMDRPFMLVVRCSGDSVDVAEQAISSLVASNTKAHVLKAKSHSAAGADQGALDLTYEVRLKDGETAFVAAVCAIEGVTDANLVSYNGDYLG